MRDPADPHPWDQDMEGAAELLLSRHIRNVYFFLSSRVRSLASIKCDLSNLTVVARRCVADTEELSVAPQGAERIESPCNDVVDGAQYRTFGYALVIGRFNTFIPKLLDVAWLACLQSRLDLCPESAVSLLAR